MADCRFCGKKAGFFRSAHQECVDQKRAEMDAQEAAAQEAREAEIRAKSERLMSLARDIVTAAKESKPTAVRLENDDRSLIEVSSLPFNLMKSESLIYLEDHVSYHKYIRQRSGWEKVDTGIFGITTKHIYFAGVTQRFRIRLEKIVSHEAWQDALSVTRDNETAQLEYFVTENPRGAAAMMTAAYEAM